MKLKMCLLVGMLAGASAFANVPQVLTYNGVLARSGGFTKTETLTITFTLYDVDVTNAMNAVAVWARQLPVPVYTNGYFSTELRDDIGSNPLSTNVSLIDALSTIKGAAEIGIRPPDCPSDLMPRQRLEWNVRAGRAARAQAADIFEAKNGVNFMGGHARVDELFAKNVTVSNDVIATRSCTLLRRGARTIGGKNSAIKIKGVAPEIDAYTPKEYVVGAFTTDRAPADMVVTYAGENGAFTVIVPKGGKIESTGRDQDMPQVVNATIFGK